MNPPTVIHGSAPLVPGLRALGAALVLSAPAAASAVSYDSDGDGLIEISSLAHLNAIRWDLDGDGAADNAANDSSYASAFPDADAAMGCPTTCTGYELTADLDFDTDGDGDLDSTDEYWHSGTGWAPIGGFATTFEGNGHTIANLYINRSSGVIGLFGSVSAGGQVRNVGVRDVAVTGSGESGAIGGLVGYNHQGSIVSSYATGTVTGSGESSVVGGLVGSNGGASGGRSSVVSSYATAVVTNFGGGSVGGLVGRNGTTSRGHSSIVSSYATGAVTGSGNYSEVGGLVGRNRGTSGGRSSIVASYWNTETSGQASGGGAAVGKTTEELRTPTGYSGIYANWNRDLDGDGTADDPWDFGTDSEYPVLRADFDGDGGIDSDAGTAADRVPPPSLGRPRRRGAPPGQRCLPLPAGDGRGHVDEEADFAAVGGPRMRHTVVAGCLTAVVGTAPLSVDMHWTKEIREAKEVGDEIPCAVAVVGSRSGYMHGT